MKDSEFLADAIKAKLVVDPVSGEELERTVAKFFKLDSKIVARLKGRSSREPLIITARKCNLDVEMKNFRQTGLF